MNFEEHCEVILTTPGRVIFNAEIERSLQEAASDDGQEIECVVCRERYSSNTLDRGEWQDPDHDLRYLSCDCGCESFIVASRFD